MRGVLWSLLLVPVGLWAQEQAILSLEARLSSTPDSLKPEVQRQLAKQYFFYSFKHPDSVEFRRAILEKGLAIAQQSRDTLLMAAHHLELTHFLPNDSAIKVLNFYHPMLDSLSRHDFSNTIAALMYASMSIEILKLGGFKKFLARLLYSALPEVDYDRALLHLLQVKLAGEFLVVTYYRLAECYFALRNHRDALASLDACLKAEERYPYMDAYFKSRAKARLERYYRERR